ncbi:nucleotidyltransferase [Clostridium sulfidigenes]|uniref:Nucleotidyltransferase n=1 Tax=Clostridium sulfidigenes TaxID=318464 RepID=A0A084J9N5_9CLOT|nr:sugar phosphate nucleotidyltransferase [Clostridium sulfidigenes]KEZ85669.1 nucleotidyltransferase [Clostridium sulfidigenes]
MNETTLVVMAAGMGSRFGNLKQLEPVGPNGEIILDFSIYDAVKAGFSKVVFIIKKEMEKDFRHVIGKRIEKIIDVDYAFQTLDKIPQGCFIPNNRSKPWGTGHAVICAKSAVSTPFMVINADDYYGSHSYKIVGDYLSQNKGMCMAGFRLKNTLTENGTVSRGLCEIEKGYLKSVVEHTSIDKNSGIPLDSMVSMNMWGFDIDIFNVLEQEFTVFLKNLKNPLKDEFYLPSVVDNMIKTQSAKVKVLETLDKWYGVTYKEDLPTVKNAINQMIREGLYHGI